LLTISLLISTGFFHKVLARLKHGNAKSPFTLSGATTTSETISSTETQRFGATIPANSYINF
jgi:Holliday junction resolvasome RuvABC ATP-dependent DNA helicase subunit